MGDHWRQVWATTGGPSLSFVNGGRLVVCYLYDRLIYYGVNPIVQRVCTDKRPIG